MSLFEFGDNVTENSHHLDWKRLKLLRDGKLQELKE